jgi:hypothetical protein
MTSWWAPSGPRALLCLLALGSAVPRVKKFSVAMSPVFLVPSTREAISAPCLRCCFPSVLESAFPSLLPRIQTTPLRSATPTSSELEGEVL